MKYHIWHFLYTIWPFRQMPIALNFLTFIATRIKSWVTSVQFGTGFPILFVTLHMVLNPHNKNRLKYKTKQPWKRNWWAPWCMFFSSHAWPWPKAVPILSWSWPMTWAEETCLFMATFSMKLQTSINWPHRAFSLTMPMQHLYVLPQEPAFNRDSILPG